MAECNFVEVHNIYPNLKDKQLFRLNKLGEVRDYFITEIREIELTSKRLSKYIVFFIIIILITL